MHTAVKQPLNHFPALAGRGANVTDLQNSCVGQCFGGIHTRLAIHQYFRWGCPLGWNLTTMVHSERSSWTEHSISVCFRLSCISPTRSLKDNWRRAGSSYDQGTQPRPKLEALLMRCSSPQPMFVPNLSRRNGTPGKRGGQLLKSCRTFRHRPSPWRPQ